MSATAWWVIVGVVLVLAVLGAMRFDVLGALLRDKLEHPADRGIDAAAAAARAGHEAAPHGEGHHAHESTQRKPPYHRSGRR